MKGNELLDIVELIDPKYIIESDEISPTHIRKCVKLCKLVACITVSFLTITVVIVSFAGLHNTSKSDDVSYETAVAFPSEQIEYMTVLIDSITEKGIHGEVVDSSLDLFSYKDNVWVEFINNKLNSSYSIGDKVKVTFYEYEFKKNSDSNKVFAVEVE